MDVSTVEHAQSSMNQGLPSLSADEDKLKPASSEKHWLFTPEMGKAAAAKSIERKRQREAEAEQAKAIVGQLKAAAIVEPSELYRLTRLARVRAQLAQVDSAIEEAIKSPKPEKGALKSLVEAQDRLSEQERKLDNRALPGSRRPGRETPTKRSGEVGPVE